MHVRFEKELKNIMIHKALRGKNKYIEQLLPLRAR